MKITVKARRTLEVITNLAVLLVCITVLVGLFRTGVIAHLSGSRRQPSSSALLKQGQIFQAASVLHISGPPAIVPALNANCHFCAESLPFYKRLGDIKRDVTAPTVIMVFPNSQPEVHAFLKELDSAPLSIFAEQNFADLGISGTPTVIFVDATGVIRRVWIGKLSEDEEREIMNVAGLAVS